MTLDTATIDVINAVIKLCSTAIGVEANFDVHFNARQKCSRCLGAFEKKYNVATSLIYVEGQDPFAGSEKVSLKKTDIHKTYYSGGCIDLGLGIREAIVLSIPITILCEDSCKGLCPVCGKNRNRSKCTCKVKTHGLFTPVIKKKKRRIRKKAR